MPEFTPAQNKYLRELMARWEKAERGERTALLAEGMATLNVSRATLYRALRPAGALCLAETRSSLQSAI